jgi:hypothetical protein
MVCFVVIKERAKKKNVSHAVKSVVAEKKIVEKKGEIPTYCLELCIYLNERQPNTCEFCG